MSNIEFWTGDFCMCVPNSGPSTNGLVQRASIEHNGTFRIGTSSLSAKLYVHGPIDATSSIISNSYIRSKTRIIVDPSSANYQNATFRVLRYDTDTYSALFQGADVKIEKNLLVGSNSTTLPAIEVAGEVNAPAGFRVGSSTGDDINNAPWYGLGLSNIADPSGEGSLVQVGGYYGIGFSTAGATAGNFSAILRDGKFGIGTNTPAAPLHVMGNVALESTTQTTTVGYGTNNLGSSVSLAHFNYTTAPGNVFITGQSSNTSAQSGAIVFRDYTGSATQENMRITKDGNIYAGFFGNTAASPSDNGDLFVNHGILVYPFHKTGLSGVESRMAFVDASGTNIRHAIEDNFSTHELVITPGKTTGSKRTLRISAGGTGTGELRVVIGDKNPYPSMPGKSFSFAVDGAAVFKEVWVQTADWADYVFDDSYRLRPLQEVGTFIQENHHLPDVPSAATVAAEGINLGSMDAVLLRKIEELTLYMIELQRQNEVLKGEIEALKTQK